MLGHPTGFFSYAARVQNTVIFLTTSSTSPWTVPTDWNPTNNTIECIGGGGGGASPNGVANQASGGGGGGYSKKVNLALSAGQQVVFTIGAGGVGGTTDNGGTGGNTFFGNTTLATSFVGAQGGAGGQRIIAGATGGSIFVGDIGASGGNGGATTQRATAFVSSGGGGAGGPHGVGGKGGAENIATPDVNSGGGTGGGGSDGGLAGGDNATNGTGGSGPGGTYGTTGGTASDGTAGGTFGNSEAAGSNGAVGSHGSGGGGGGGIATASANGWNGGKGGNGVGRTQTSDLTVAGPGGGGGAGGGVQSIPSGGGASLGVKVFNSANYSYTNTRWVKTTGNDASDGLTLGTAWKTIGKAILSAPADCLIRVQPGTYTEAPVINGNNRAFIGDTTDPLQRPFINGNSYGVLSLKGATNTVVDNFKIQATEGGAGATGNYGSPIYIGGAGLTDHHITIRNCELLGVNSTPNGIHVYAEETTICDYLTFEDNTIHAAPTSTSLGWTSNIGPSGVSLFQLKKLDSLAGAHCIVRRNFMYNIAQNHISDGIGATNITDGNGVILDGLVVHTYDQDIHIYDNIIVYPGAQGVNIYNGTNRVYVFNNTVYQPGRCAFQTSCNGSGSGAGIFFNSAQNITAFNNFVWGRPGAVNCKTILRSGTTTGSTGDYNGSYQVTGNDAAGAHDVTGLSPLFASPSTTSTSPNDWIPQAGSPLLLKGVASMGGVAAPTKDFFNTNETSPPVIGASSDHAPGFLGGVGANGGNYGGGGGGGGRAVITSSTGAGGNGAPGIIIISYWNQIVSGTSFQVFLDASLSSPWTVPASWNSSNNTVEVIGGGGAGTLAVGQADGGGGGGGAYSKILNLSLTPGGTAAFGVGLGGATTGTNGANSWFNGTSLASCSVGAEGGFANGTAGGRGGSSANGVGTTKFSGGAGGGGATAQWAASGGGGAGGPNGTGGAGGLASVNSNNFFYAGGGGGGADAGSAGSGPVSQVGGHGGNDRLGVGGGSDTGFANGANGASGAVGSNHCGGAGGAGGMGSGGTVTFAGAGGPGGRGSNWTQTSNNYIAGPGGGGGGAGNMGTGNVAGPGATGAIYGGGGGGGVAGRGAGPGGNGIIVITWTTA